MLGSVRAKAEWLSYSTNPAAMTIGQGHAAEVTIRHQGKPRDGDAEQLWRVLTFIALLPEKPRELVGNARAELAEVYAEWESES